MQAAQNALAGHMQDCCKKTRPKKPTRVFLKTPTKKKTTNPPKKPTLYFFCEKIY